MQDECFSYRTISDPTRLISRRNGSCQGDKTLVPGWYQYSGAAGNMMLNYCPSNMSSDQYYCGALLRGWMRGSLPERSDGIVNRYVKGTLGEEISVSSKTYTTLKLLFAKN